MYKEIIEYLENKIKRCDEFGDMKKEKWVFQTTLKEVRKLNERQASSDHSDKHEQKAADVNATLPIQEIGDAIEKECEEHITTEGLRFSGTSWAQITRILQKYGFKKEPPF